MERPTLPGVDCLQSPQGDVTASQDGADLPATQADTTALLASIDRDTPWGLPGLLAV